MRHCQIGTTLITRVKHTVNRAKDIDLTMNQTIAKHAILVVVMVVNRKLANVLNATIIDVQDAIVVVVIVEKLFVMTVQSVAASVQVCIAVIALASVKAAVTNVVRRALTHVRNVASRRVTIVRKNVLIVEIHFVQNA